LGRRAAETAPRDGRSGEPPAPGDVLVARSTRAYPREWVVVDRQGDRLLVVPADTNPLVGTGDAWVPAAAPSGPLALRCRHALWLAERALSSAARTGALSAEFLEEARRKWRAVAAGEDPGEVLEQEVDADPAYQDWIAEVVTRARAALAEAAGAPGGGVRRGRPGTGWPPIPLALAATFAVATAGLSVWVVLLRGKVERLSQPVVDPARGEVVFGGGTRGTGTVTVAQGASHLLLVVVLESETPVHATYRLAILNREGGLRWESAPLPDTPLREYRLILPGRFASAGELRLRLSGVEGGRSFLLEEVALKVLERAAEPGR
jgi:hypothetical protein